MRAPTTPLSTLALCLALVTLGCPGDDDPVGSADAGTTPVEDASTDAGSPPTDTGSPPPTDTGGGGTDTTVAADEGGTTTGAPSPETVALHGECSLDVRYGAILVHSDDNDGYSFTEAVVADGVVPISMLEEVGSVGDCKLLRRNNPFCEELCQAGTTCDFSGECIPWPENQDIGTISIAGLKEPVAMSPVQPGNSYFDTGLPYPVVELGALVTATTTAGAYGELLLYGVGADAILPTNEQIDIAEGGGLPVEWAAAPDGARTRVVLTVTIDQHGATPVQLRCDFPDTGAGTVDPGLVGQLLGFGVTGFPNGRLSRRTVDSTAVGEGCMELVVERVFELKIRVPGHTPCTKPQDCPSGQDCNLQLQTCE